MDHDWTTWVTLGAAVVAAFLALEQRVNQERYVAFLRRVYVQAADVADQAKYGAAVYPVSVEGDELDLAFRALAQDLIRLDSDGTWQAPPVRLPGGRLPR